MDSARRYIQMCTAMLILHNIPVRLHQVGQALAPCVDQVLFHLNAVIPAAKQDARVWFRL
jgi:hypothetical protein